jgi:hypothetical protein
MMSQANKHSNQIVCRTVPTDLMLTRAVMQTCKPHLPDTLSLDLKPHGNLQVRYNVSAIRFDQVLQILLQAGIRPKKTRWFRIKAALYRFVDANVAAQAKARPKPCCNRVPKL